MKSIVRWSINNSAGLNIIVIAVLVVGTLAFMSLRRESFPEFDLDRILVAVAYPGAAPQEVEEAICLKIEAAVRSIEGIDKVTSVASEGSGNIVLELNSVVLDKDQVVAEVRSAVDRIASFPEEAEDPAIAMVTSRRTAIRVGVIGPTADDKRSELKLRHLAEQIHDELLLLKQISQVDISGSRNYQVDIEIPEATLRAYNLTLRQVAEIVRRENRELPAGSIRSETQEVLLRANNRKTRGVDIAKIPLVTQPNGAVLTIGDLGTVRDEFVDTAAISRINGKPGLALTVQRSKTEDLIAVVDSVNRYIKEKNLPYGYEMITWGDKSVEVRSRLQLLLKNGWQGLLIVLVLLVLFLEIRLAFWVAMGIPFVFMITGGYLYMTGQTLNMISMFAFVMALGIVVDDAIVVGENIYVHRGMGKNFRQAAYDGAVEVMPSVTASVSTTIVAFSPLLFVSGVMGKFMAVMPAAIIAMLVASLIESVTILPCHLSHKDSLLFTIFRVLFYPFLWIIWIAKSANKKASAGLAWFIENVYSPTLAWSLNHRLVVMGGGIGIMLAVAGLYRSGAVKSNFFPKLDGNSLSANITFPDGTPESLTDKWTQHIEASFWRVSDRFEQKGEKIASVSYRTVGQQISSGGPGGSGQVTGSGSHVGTVEIELLSTEFRSIRSDRIAAAWRKEVGIIPGTEELSIAARGGGPGGIAIEFKVLASSDHTDELDRMVESCKKELEKFPGTFDVKDDSVPGKWEYRFRIKEQAVAMGVRLSDLAETVRGAFHGEEVMRLQRGRHEVKLMVRYPKDERRTLSNFDEIRVRLDDGIERPITELAEIDIVKSYSEINRIDQMRSITVSADLDEKVGNADLIVKRLQDEIIPHLQKTHSNTYVRWEGQQQRRAESLGSLKIGFIVALLVMFVLLAIEFRSYFQPFLILLIIPFGIVGAVLGHAAMGLQLTIFSMFGLVALTGIVVNDSIVLIDFINAKVRAGMPIQKALTEAGKRRFRPVMLTTVTTIGGLSPILFERSFQAQILIPMATSVAFGEMFATVLVLYLVPVTYSLYWTIIGQHNHHYVEEIIDKVEQPRDVGKQNYEVPD